MFEIEPLNFSAISFVDLQFDKHLSSLNGNIFLNGGSCVSVINDIFIIFGGARIYWPKALFNN